MKTDKTTPFWDVSLPIQARLDWLLSAMTIEEKLDCLATRMPDLERLGIPGMSVGGEAAHGVEARNDQNEFKEPETTTSFPQPIGMSATWDTELVKKAGMVTGTEARVLYHRHPDRGLSRWAPTVDLERDPRWGRCEEGYGEDPYLTGEMASAYIQGMQGDDPCYLRIAATLKHFYGNNTEAGRGHKNSSIDPRNLYELYLEPFRRCIVQGKAEAIMTAYNKINGIPGMLNSQVNTILKKQYGLGHAVCDGGAMALVADYHHYYGTHAETLAGAVKAGIDAMSDNPALVAQAAREAYDLGLLTEEEIDGALRNMFRTRLRLGIYDAVSRNPYDTVTEDDLNSPLHQEICRQVSRESIVLLKNETNLLPLSRKDAQSIAIIGPLGDIWYQDWYGGTAYAETTLRQGVEAVTGQTVSYTDGLDRVLLKCGDKGIAVLEDGTLALSDTPDVFIMQDWGEGSITFRCARTGCYMNSRLYVSADEADQVGRIAAEKERTFDWFVMEIFHLESQEDGALLLTNRFDHPVMAAGDGSLWAKPATEQTGPVVGIDLNLSQSETGHKSLTEVHFTVEVIESGMKQAIALAKEKQTVILALGCNPMINAKEETDRSTILLPPAQEALLEAVCQANPDIVLTLFSNYPYAIRAAQEKVPAILWSATGSQDMGTAMAETLFGINAPAGRLNMTWYADDSSLPDIDDYDIIKGNRTYRYFDDDVLYPFGHGLTYSAFAYSDLTVTLADQINLSVSFTIQNTGSRISDEVVQVYGTAPASRVKKPRRQLLAFDRIKAIQPGESRKISFLIPIAEFRFYDVISQSLMVEAGTYTICAGSSSKTLPLTAHIALCGGKPGLRDLSRRIKADHYDDYEHIVLSEGQFGFTAAEPLPGQEGSLYYRDCSINPEARAVCLHLLSVQGGHLELLLKRGTAGNRQDAEDRQGGGSKQCGDNWQSVGCWQGDTRTYSQVPQAPMSAKAAEETMARIATWKPVYTDVRIPLNDTAAGILEELHDTKTPAELAIRLSGDIKLCYFRVE